MCGLGGGGGDDVDFFVGDERLAFGSGLAFCGGAAEREEVVFAADVDVETGCEEGEAEDLEGEGGGEERGTGGLVGFGRGACGGDGGVDEPGADAAGVEELEDAHGQGDDEMDG